MRVGGRGEVPIIQNLPSTSLTINCVLATESLKCGKSQLRCGTITARYTSDFKDLALKKQTVKYSFILIIC